MSFWDDLGMKLTTGSQDALQKTRDIAGVVTMNADISDSKRRIRDLYGEIGELIVKEAFEGLNSEQIKEMLDGGKADSESIEISIRNWKELYTKVMFIRSEEEVIALNEARINELKTETRCPRCGKRIAKGGIFCPRCGTRIVPAGEEAGQNEAAEQAAAAEESASAEQAAPEVNSASAEQAAPEVKNDAAGSAGDAE